MGLKREREKRRADRDNVALSYVSYVFYVTGRLLEERGGGEPSDRLHTLLGRVARPGAGAPRFAAAAEREGQSAVYFLLHLLSSVLCPATFYEYSGGPGLAVPGLAKVPV